MKRLGIGNGYLLNHLSKYIDIDITNKRLNEVTINDIKDYDEIFLFASPISDNDMKDVKIGIKTMTNDTIKVIDMIDSLDKKIIFASSEAIYDLDSVYALCKKIIECYLEDKHLILRIPRVYSSDRDKGLIKKLKKKTFIGYKTEILEYMDIEDWVKETISFLSYNGIKEYRNKRKNTIEEIEKIYLGSK